MKKIYFSQLFFSSVFFIVSIFTILLLFLSGFVHELSQMFRLMTKPYGVYFIVEVAFLIFGVILSVFSLFRLYRLPKLYLIVIFFMACIFGILFYLESFIVSRIYLDLFSLEDMLKFNNDNMFVKTYYQMIVDYIMYLLFIIIPSFIYLLSLRFDKNTKIGKILKLTKPNFNVIISALFAFCISPFFSGNLFGYIDLCLYLFGFALILTIVFKKKIILDSYEYFNLFLLILLMCVMIFCSHRFVDSESYFEIRKALYAFVVFGWCSIWMIKLKDKTQRGIYE